jgi:TraB/PrgY/gumN family
VEVRAPALGVACALVAATPSPIRAQPSEDARTEDIVVTATRSGIPVWRVTGPRTTIVLVGTIRRVDEETRWDAASLTEALRKSDRVMFPGAVRYTASILYAPSLAAKAKKMASLPRGQTLARHLSPDQYRRLVSLSESGWLKPGFERKHPLQVANDLIQEALGGPGGGFISISKIRPGQGDADSWIKAAVRKYHLNLVPIPTARLKPVMKEYLAGPPAEHSPCLLAAMALAEAGRGENRARSEAWANRHVPQVLASPAQKALETCSPEPMRRDASPEARRTVRTLLDEPLVTVAVFELGALAEPGGILDELLAEGFEIKGPRWK